MSIAGKVWFITGVSRGLGKILAVSVLAQGGHVIGTTRDGKSDITPSGDASGKFNVFKLDVTQHDEVFKVVKQAHAIHGKLDVIVNNAGYGQLGPVEEVSLEKTRIQLETNFFGPFSVLQAVLPFLRAQKFGHILNVSSIQGFAPTVGCGVYAASKFALSGLSDSLALELKPFGVHVTIVEPGSFRTDFLAPSSLVVSADKSSSAIYPEVVNFLNRLERNNGLQVGDPAKAAQVIIDITTTPTPPLHFFIGSDALARSRAKIAKTSADIETWAAVSASTDFKTQP